MQSITLVVTRTGGRTDEVSCLAADFVAFEMHFDKPISALESGRLTYLYWLAWHALHREKRTADDFDTWIGDTIAIDSKGDGADELPPLERNQPTG